MTPALGMEDHWTNKEGNVRKSIVLNFQQYLSEAPLWRPFLQLSVNPMVRSVLPNFNYLQRKEFKVIKNARNDNQ